MRYLCSLSYVKGPQSPGRSLTRLKPMTEYNPSGFPGTAGFMVPWITAPLTVMH